VQEIVALIRMENERWYDEHQSLLAQRKSQGFIRECHGDMHLNNMILSEKESRYLIAWNLTPRCAGATC